MVNGLKLLDQLETVREKALRKPEDYPTDYTVRLCEAIVAEAFGFKDRNEWTEPLLKDPNTEYHVRMAGRAPEEQKAAPSGRVRFTPEVGSIYENQGGGTFLCKSEGDNAFSAVMENVESHWTFTAYGCSLYPDGTIDWDYSVNGRFAEA